MSLVNHLIENRVKFLRQCQHLTKDMSKADDLFQDTCEFLLKHKPSSPVRHPNTYVRQVIIHRWANTIRGKNYRKFNIMADLFDHESTPEKYLADSSSSQNENLHNKQVLNNLSKAIDSLPEKQKKAILQVLETEFIRAEEGEQYNTLKANRRHGFLKLRTYFIENKIDMSFDL